MLTLIPFILAVNWLTITFVLKFQEIIDFFIVQFCLGKPAKFKEVRNLAGGLKIKNTLNRQTDRQTDRQTEYL